MIFLMVGLTLVLRNFFLMLIFVLRFHTAHNIPKEQPARRDQHKRLASSNHRITSHDHCVIDRIRLSSSRLRADRGNLTFDDLSGAHVELVLGFEHGLRCLTLLVSVLGQSGDHPLDGGFLRLVGLRARFSAILKCRN